MGSDELLKFWFSILVFERKSSRLFFAQFFFPLIFSLLAVYVFTQTSWSKYDGTIPSEFAYTDIIRRPNFTVSPVQVFFHNCNVLYDIWKHVKNFDVQCLEPHYMPDISSYKPDQSLTNASNALLNYTHEISLRIVNLSLKLKRNQYSPWGVLSIDLEPNYMDENEVLTAFIQESIVEGLSRYVKLNIHNSKKHIIAMPVFKYSLLKSFKFLALISIGACSPGIWHFISLYEKEQKSNTKSLLKSLGIVKLHSYVLSHFLLYAIKFFIMQLLFWSPIYIYKLNYLRISNFLVSATLISFNLSAFCLSVCSTFRSRYVSAVVLFGSLLACYISFFGWNDFLPNSFLSYSTTIFFPVAYQFYMRTTANGIMSDKFQDLSSTFSIFLSLMLVLDCILMLLWTMFREGVFERQKKIAPHRLKISSSVITETRTILMELSDVKVTKRQEKVLSDINLSICKDEITAFYGEGSRELLQTIRGDLFNTGSIFVFDEALLLLVQIRQVINIDYYEMLDELGLASVGHLYHHELKKTDRYLLNIMFTFLSNASIILLSDPFNCDVSVHLKLSRFMRKQKNEKAIVFTSQNLDILNGVVDSVVLLADREVWRQLSSSELRKETQVLILSSRVHLDAAKISAIKKKVCACLGSKFKGRLVSYRQPKGALTFKAPSISLIRYSKLLKFLRTELSFGIDNCELKVSTPIDDYIRFCESDNSTSNYSNRFVSRLSSQAISTVFPDVPNIIDQKLKFFSKNAFASILSFFVPLTLSLFVCMFNYRSALNRGYLNIPAYMNEHANSFFFVSEKEGKSLSTNHSNCSYLTEHLQYNFGVVQRENTTYLCHYASSMLSKVFLNQIWQNLFYDGVKLNVSIETIHSPNWRFLIDAFSHLNTSAGGIPLPVISVAVSDNWLEMLVVGIDFLLCVSHVTTFSRELVEVTRCTGKKRILFWLTLSMIDFLMFVSLMTACAILVVLPHHGAFVSLLTVSSSSIAFVSSLPFIYMISLKSDNNLSACFSLFQLLGGFLLPSIFSLFSTPFSSQFEASISQLLPLSTIFPPIAPALVTGLGAYYKSLGRGNLFITKQVSHLYLISFLPVWTWIIIIVMNKEVIPKIEVVVRSIHSKCHSSLRKSRMKATV